MTSDQAICRTFRLVLLSLSIGCGDEPPLVPPELPAPVAVEQSTSEHTPTRDGEDPDFHAMMDVLVSPRCVNCHPNDGVPKQTDLGRPHLFGVQRGEANLGAPALQCSTCHQDENNDDSGVPGAPEWSLAPAAMEWEGLDRYAIARSMLNRASNGERSLEEVRHHLTDHPLVLWAWAPGVDAEGEARLPPPVPLDEYRSAVNRWFAAGAQIPGDPPRRIEDLEPEGSEGIESDGVHETESDYSL
ncbi:MAG: hypothetical protein ACI9KE_002742 [Polyangiales bacterium]|jgi:hypothetical protein